MEVEDFLLGKLRVWEIVRRAQTGISFGCAVGTLPNIHNEHERLKPLSHDECSDKNFEKTLMHNEFISVFLTLQI